jgi:cell division protein FtsB
MENFKTIGTTILVLLVVLGIAVGAYFLKRTINYNLYYKTQVAEQIEPLNKRIQSLEARIQKLEKRQ